jgi:hypothetical protein
MTIKEDLAQYGGFIDVGILSHGFAPYMRDYDVLFEALWGRETWADAKGTYRLRFTHCTEATFRTALSDSGWRQSWPEVFIDHAKWVAAGAPEGFVWGACRSTAYPGLSYISESKRAREWSERLGKSMHEVSLETEAFKIHLVFSEFTVTKLSDEVRVLHKVMFPLDRLGDSDAG